LHKEIQTRSNIRARKTEVSPTERILHVITMNSGFKEENSELLSTNC